MRGTSRLMAMVAAAAGLLVGLMAGCGDGTPADRERASITVVLDWTPNTNHAGVYLARDLGLYREAGLDVDIVEPDQGGGLPQLAAGNADIAFSYAEQLLPARAQGSDVVSIAAILTTNTSSIVAPADRGIRRPRDLEGRTYGAFGGPLERALIDALVRCDGGDPRRVSFVDVGNTDYSIGFRRRAYDAVWVFDGWDVVRFREIDELDIVTIPFRDNLRCIPDWYTPILAASRTTIQRSPETLRRFLEATADGYRRAAADPAAAAVALTRAVPELDTRLVRSSARFLADFYLDDEGRWGVQDAAVWARFAGFLADAGVLTGIGPVPDAYTNVLLPAP